MIGRIGTCDPITSAHERTLSADNACSQPITSVWQTNFEMERFPLIYWWGNPGNLLKSSARKHQEVNVFCFVFRFLFFFRRCFRSERKYLKDNKDNKLLLASAICTDSCPWFASQNRQYPWTTVHAYFLAQSSLLFIYMGSIWPWPILSHIWVWYGSCPYWNHIWV